MLAGCARAPLAPEVASGAAAYAAMPPIDPREPLVEYRIGPFDIINVTVFQEPDVSLRDARVDAAGIVPVPLIGNVAVAGRTASEVSSMISARLGARYLVNPSVTVQVTTAASQRVTVDGAVSRAGVFPLQGRSTLLEAIALAGGMSGVAAADEVVVFRTIDGKMNAAVFNVSQIQRGFQPNPAIYGNDVVVVGIDNVKSTVRTALGAAPFLMVFRPLVL